MWSPAPLVMAKQPSASKSPAGKALVIVESPAKARTIGRFLGDAYEVQASIGHVRDLPSRGADLPAEFKKSPHARLGVDLDQNFEPFYVVPRDKKEQIKTLKRMLKTAPALWLATDEDREGEAIAWHLTEVLNPKVPVHRLVFHEITKEAIGHALDNPRDIDMDLVHAQETRRILDRLYGYEVSPVLWRKIRTGLSAGRVQSVALRLLVEREQARIAFRAATYWDLEGTFASTTDDAKPFSARLVELAGARIATGKDFDPNTGRLREKSADAAWLDEAATTALKERLDGKPGEVLEVEEKPYSRKPAPPFTTSTLQQEAGRKLRLSARQAMRLAQTLYENGVITYMRTDSTALSKEAIDGARAHIREAYGAPYLPPKPRHYKTKVKNAQEAHEAIRPAGARFQEIGAVRKAHGPQAAALYSADLDAHGRFADARRARPPGDGAGGGRRRGLQGNGKHHRVPGLPARVRRGLGRPRGRHQRGRRRERAPGPRKGPGTRREGPRGRVAHDAAAAALHRREPRQGARCPRHRPTQHLGRDHRRAARPRVRVPQAAASSSRRSRDSSWSACCRAHFERLLDYDFTARMEDDLDSVSRGEGDGRAYLQQFYLGNGEDGLARPRRGGDRRGRSARGLPPASSGESDGKTIEIRVGQVRPLRDGRRGERLAARAAPCPTSSASRRRRKRSRKRRRARAPSATIRRRASRST